MIKRKKLIIDNIPVTITIHEEDLTTHEKLLVKSDNPIYQPFEVDLKTDSVDIIGAVVYVMNDMSCL